MSAKQKIAVGFIIAVLAVGAIFCGLSWRLTWQDWDLVSTELSSTQEQLSDTQYELDGVQSELQETQAALLDTRENLQNTKSELTDVSSELKDTRARLSTTKDELSEAKNELSAIKTELQATKASLSTIQTNAYSLHDPSYDEVIKFLKEDETDSNQYIPHRYVCSHFARDVNNNAESKGIRCAWIEVRYPDSAHVIIGFDTTDKGIVYFDPQYDVRVKPVIGKRYYQCIEPMPDWVWTRPSYDDTIADLVVIW